MNKWKYLLYSTITIILMATVSAAAVAPLSLELGPDEGNPSSPVMGDHMLFWSAITNTGRTSIEGLVAWISLVEIDPGNEQPVDLEDWSAHKAITGAALEPGQSLRTRLAHAADQRRRLPGGDQCHRPRQR